jgi:xylose isomerase
VGFIQSSLKRPEFWGINPELLQHESMALNNAVLTVGYLTSLKKLSFLHFGSQIKAQFDNDFPPLIGPEGLKETVQMFWALDKVGWKGVVEYDCHMLRAEADPDDPLGCRREFIKNCTNALSISLALAARLRGFSADGMTDTQADLAATMAMCNLSAKELA